jgi:hypothetical protein
LGDMGKRFAFVGAGFAVALLSCGVLVNDEGLPPEVGPTDDASTIAPECMFDGGGVACARDASAVQSLQPECLLGGGEAGGADPGDPSVGVT